MRTFSQIDSARFESPFCLRRQCCACPGHDCDRIVSPSPARTSSQALTNMPGRNFHCGLAISIRTRTVRHQIKKRFDHRDLAAEFFVTDAGTAVLIF